MIKFTYLEQSANSFTFEMPKLKAWVENQCEGKVLNLFAGKTLLAIDEVRNDIDRDMPAQYHLDAEEFVKMAIEKGWKFNTIIIDPPYNWRKAKELYNGNYIGHYPILKDLLKEIINDNGLVITFGYDSVGMSASRGFKKIEICLICHNGDSKDTICLVERKLSVNKTKIAKSSKFKEYFQ